MVGVVKNAPPPSHPQKLTLGCLITPKFYIVGDIHIKTLSPEGQTSSQGS